MTAPLIDDLEEYTYIAVVGENGLLVWKYGSSSWTDETLYFGSNAYKAQDYWPGAQLTYSSQVTIPSLNQPTFEFGDDT